MNGPIGKLARCAIYTRKSTEHNLELAFNSLDAQREACEAYIKSQAHEGWRLIPTRYDDGAFSGASLERLALQQLLADVRADTIDIGWFIRSIGSPAHWLILPRLLSCSIRMPSPSCLSRNPSTPAPAWAGSRSMFCCHLPNLNGS